MKDKISVVEKMCNKLDLDQVAFNLTLYTLIKKLRSTNF